MSSVLNLPEKRQYLDQDQILEQTPKNRQKLDDPQPPETNDTGTMSIVNLPEKRQNLDQDQILEQSPKNLQMLDDPQPPETNDTEMEQQKGDDKSGSFFEMEQQKGDYKSRSFFGWCPICKVNGNHWYYDCPNKARGFGMFCFICSGPCKKNGEGEHGKRIVEILKWCYECGNQGCHWAEDCFLNNRDEEPSGSSSSSGDHGI